MISVVWWVVQSELQKVVELVVTLVDKRVGQLVARMVAWWVALSAAEKAVQLVVQMAVELVGTRVALMVRQMVETYIYGINSSIRYIEMKHLLTLEFLLAR